MFSNWIGNLFWMASANGDALMSVDLLEGLRQLDGRLPLRSSVAPNPEDGGTAYRGLSGPCTPAQAPSSLEGF